MINNCLWFADYNKGNVAEDSMKDTNPDRRSLTPEELFSLGAGDIAYVKPMVVSGQSFYLVCAADSTPIILAPERETAFAAARQHELTPASVH